MAPMTISVGVLAFQGAFSEHKYCLEKCWPSVGVDRGGPQPERGLRVVEVRTPEHLAGLHGLIIPGGESTTMSIFLQRNGFSEALHTWIAGTHEYRPQVWGTCAGLILLANKVEDKKTGGQFTIGGLSITCTRNMFGRQCESFERELDVRNGISAMTIVEDVDHSPRGASTNISTTPPSVTRKCSGVFIRAPGIKSLDSPDVRVIASFQDGEKEKIVAVEQGNLMATSFHPELTRDLTWHRYFLQKICDTISVDA